MRSGVCRAAPALVAALLAGTLAACSWVPSPFARMAQDAASTFSSAAMTLRFEHPDPGSGETRLTREYATAAFVSYAEAVSNVADELPKAQGAPDQAAAQKLADLVRAAAAVVQQPCLDPTCDWSSQVEQLDEAKSALLDAAK